MAQIRPINLGASRTTFGLQPLLADALAQTNPAPLDEKPLSPLSSQLDATAPPSSTGAGANWEAMAAALQGTPQVQGGSPFEAVTAALTGGIRGLASRDQAATHDKQEAAQNQWQQALEQRQQGEWKQQDQQQQAGQDFVSSLPTDQQPLARVNPSAAASSMLTARAQATQPITPYQTADLGETRRHDVAMENKPTGGASTFTPEDIDFYAQQGITQGGLPRSISIRSPNAAPILSRMRVLAQQQNIPAARLNSIEAAYHGDRNAYGKLNETYNNVVAFERTTDSFLTNLQTLAQRVPQNQISDSGFMNQAIQNYNHGVNQSPQLSAYIGALVSTRMELARTLGGSVSPPVESMHDAEAILPNDIGLQALQNRQGVATNIHNEMQLRGQSLRGTLDDIQSRIESGEVSMPGGAGAPPPAAGAPPPAGPQAPPQVGATRTFQNGRVGRWDGHGWVQQ